MGIETNDEVEAGLPESLKETRELRQPSRREALKQISALAGTTLIAPLLSCGKGSDQAPVIDAPVIDAPVIDAPVIDAPVTPSCTTPGASVPHTTTGFDPDDEYYDSSFANAESASTQWNMRRIGAREAWDPAAGAGSGSGSVTIYLFDAGVRLDHPDLPPYATVPTAARLTQFSFNQLTSTSGVNLSTENADSSGALPANFHGTRMAGILAAVWGSGFGSGVSGLAPACEFVSLRVSDVAPGPLTPSDVVAAINTAGFDSTARGKRGVLCLATEPSLLQDTLGMPTAEAALAAHPNLLVVAPSGALSAPYPGAVPTNLVICGATDKTNLTSRYDDWKEDGGFGDEGSREGPDICVVAPGVGIITTDVAGAPPYVGNAQGTSIAAAHVAGIAALVRSKNAALVTGAAVRRQLEQTAARTGPFDYRTTGQSGPWNQYMGFGRIHATAALVSGLDVDTGDSQRADVYIRDNPTDVGGNTSCSDFSSSGDVVVLTEAVRAANFPNLAPGVTTAGSSADLAFSAARDAALTSTNVSRGTDNWLFVRVVNRGPNTAFGVRVTAMLAAASTGYLYPRDWEFATTGMAVAGRPAVVGDDYAHEVPNEGIFVARLRIPAGADYAGFSSNLACVLARVLACNDVTFLRTAPVSDTAGQLPIHNNLAQRNMSLVP